MPQVPQAIRFPWPVEPEMRNLQEQRRSAADDSRLRRGAIVQLVEVDGQT